MDNGYRSCVFSIRAAESQGQVTSLYRQMLDRVFPRGPSDVTGGARPGRKTALPTLKPGDCAEVRPVEAIRETVDERGRHRGLYFMPEMERFCGRRFRVLKGVRTIKLESSGEVRRILDPTVLLEGVYCDGEAHGGCDRACLHLWREAWLRRVPATEAPGEASVSARGSPGLCLSGRMAPPD